MKRRYLDEGDDLGLPWEQWADGLPHRLKRNRDFGDIDPAIVREAAKQAAKRLGKGVQAVEDKLSVKNSKKGARYLWVQFADHEIRIGDPCKCGGRRLVRIHPFFARCTQCGAQLLLAAGRPNPASDAVESSDVDDEEADEDRPGPARLLGELTDVHLARIEHVEDRETYRGYGRLGGTLVFLIVQFHAARGERLRASEVYERAAAVQTLPLRQLDGLLDGSSLLNPDAEWDLVL